MGKSKPEPRGVQFKRITIDTKTLSENAASGEAEFDAYASVFGNVDSYGDVVHKGAFARSLKEWSAKGAPIPVFYNHGAFTNDPTDNVGYLRVAQEDEKGLRVIPVLDVEANPKAAYVYHLLKSGRLRELSIGYVSKTYDWSELDGMEVRNIRDVDLLEVSVVPVAANDQATVVEVRSALQYGSDDDAAPDADESDEKADDGSSDPEAVVEAAEAVRAAAEVLIEATAALTAALGSEEPAGDDDASDDDPDSSEAGAKSGLSLRTRATLALIALDGADKENAR